MIKIARRDPARKEWFPKIFRYLKSHKHIDKFQCHIVGSYADLIHGYDVHSFNSGKDVDIAIHSKIGSMHTTIIRGILMDIEMFAMTEFNAKFDVFHTSVDLMNNHRFFSIHNYEEMHGVQSKNKTKKVPMTIHTVTRTIKHSKTHLTYQIAPWLWKMEKSYPTDAYLKKFSSRKKNSLYQKRLRERGAWALTDIHDFDIEKWEEEHCATSSKNK